MLLNDSYKLPFNGMPAARETSTLRCILGQVDGLQARFNKSNPDLDAGAFLGIEPSVSPGGLIR